MAQDRTFSFHVPTAELAQAFADAPDIAFKRAQDFADHMARSFRKAWLAANRVKFRNPEMIAPVRHTVPASHKTLQAHRQVYFIVQPRRGPRRGRTLADIKVDIFSVSESWESLEHGATVRGKGKQMAIPIGITLDSTGRRIGRWSTPAKFTRANSRGTSRVLVAIRKKGQKATILYWRKPKGRGKKKTFVLLPAFMLISQAKIPALLNFYRSWDAHEPRRKQAARSMLDGITADIRRHRRGK